MGLSGKTLTQVRPFLLSAFVIARRPASICAALIQPRPRDFKPTSPKASSLPRIATPRLFPLNCFLNFSRLGASISLPPFFVYISTLLRPHNPSSIGLGPVHNQYFPSMFEWARPPGDIFRIWLCPPRRCARQPQF